MPRKTRKKRGGRKWAEEIIPRTLPGLIRKLKDMKGTLIRISDGPPEFSDSYKGEIGILRNAMEVRIGTEKEVHVELESRGNRWWVYLKYPGNPFKIEVEVSPDFAPAAGGGRSKSRKKRGGDFLRYLKFIHSGDPPRNSEERKWCCGAYGCRNKYPEECPDFLSKIFNWGKNKKEEMEDRARMKKMKNLYNYHATRKMNPKEKPGSYGSHCKNKEGKKWGWVAAKKGTKDMKGWRPEDQICPNYLKDCIIPERNIKYIPIQHPKNWEAPDIAFQTPTKDYKPGEITDEGLVCRPDWRDEYCLLDPVKGMFSRKKNTEKSNKQTCLTKYRKNWPASTFAAESEDRFFNKKEQLRAIEKGYKNDYWNPNNILERQKKAKEFAKEYKKKLVTDKVQAQAHAFAKKQSNEAEEGNVFFNAISNSDEIPMAEPVGGRRRKTRRRRKRRRKSRKKRVGVKRFGGRLVG